MDHFEMKIRDKDFLIKPCIEGDNLLFIAKINDDEVLFGGTANGLEDPAPADIDPELFAEIATEIDSYYDVS
jgi:hypothetical protein